MSSMLLPLQLLQSARESPTDQTNPSLVLLPVLLPVLLNVESWPKIAHNQTNPMEQLVSRPGTKTPRQPSGILKEERQCAL